MKRMMGVALMIFLLAAGNAQAGCEKCGMHKGMKGADQVSLSERVDRMAAELDLNAEQKAQVEAIMKEKMARKEQIMAQKQASAASLQEEVRAKLQGVLSAEQMKKWEAMKGDCPLCKSGKPCKGCDSKKGKMKGKCPDCMGSKKCSECKLKKHKE
jgi:hypothetical protein